MVLDRRTPIIVGVGQYLHRAATVDDGWEPVALMAEAVRTAAADAGLDGPPPAVDAIRVVNLLSWRYGNPAHVLAERLGVTAGELALTTAGGNSPQALVNRTCLDILGGRADVVVLVGGEAWRTRMRAKRAGQPLPWPTAPEHHRPVIIGDELDMTHPAEAERGVYLPVQVYPLFETALRAAAGTGPTEHLAGIAALWSRFSAVAADNPHAWSRRHLSPEDVIVVSPHNRMICWPYRKVMNANNDVDMAAALIITSVDRARALGIPSDRWVFPHAGTDCHEHAYVSNRWSLAETPAIRVGGRRALELADASVGDVAVIDLYSCFPSAVQLGAAALGLDSATTQLTRTGGLSFAGGPWNNYAMHAIATIVDELRRRPGELGLVWANGGYLTKHSFGVYGTSPPTAGFRHDRPQRAVDVLPARAVADGPEATGAANVESSTVAFDRDGAPQRAITTCLLADGRRAWATSDDPGTAAALTEGEWVGRRVAITDGVLHA